MSRWLSSVMSGLISKPEAPITERCGEQTGTRIEQRNREELLWSTGLRWANITGWETRLTGSRTPRHSRLVDSR